MDSLSFESGRQQEMVVDPHISPVEYIQPVIGAPKTPKSPSSEGSVAASTHIVSWP